MEFENHAIARMRPFVLRLALVVVILGIPILGTSYFFVRNISADIATAADERQSLSAFENIAQLLPLVEALHRRVADGRPAAISQARDDVDRQILVAERTFVVRPIGEDGRNEWKAWLASWQSVRLRPSFAALDGLIGGLRDLCSNLEDDSPLDSDPSYAIQYLSALVLREAPRSLAAIRQTMDAVAQAPRDRLGVPSIESIATGRALEMQPLAQITKYLNSAMALEPAIAPPLTALESAGRASTAAYHVTVRDILRTVFRSPGSARLVEESGRTALDAHERLWRAERVAENGLIERELWTDINRRRIIIAQSLLALALGTLGIALVGRYMLKRDRLKLVAAELESAKLRAELSQISTQRALRLQEAQFKTVFDNTDLGIVIFDERGTVAETNPAAERILGDDASDVLGAQQAAIDKFTVADRDPFTLDFFAERDDEARCFELTFSGVYYENIAQMVIMLVRDATAQRTLQHRLLHEASHDNLTHIANRASFERTLTEQIERGRAGEAYALVYVDLDHFKAVNDKFGHAAGDRVLAATAERLVAAVSSRDICARLGGDEFAVLLRGTSDGSGIESIASRLNASLEAPIPYDGTDLRVSASIGIAIGSMIYESAHDLKRDADLALYAVKQRGRNAALVYDRREAAGLAPGSVLEPRSQTA